MPWPHPCRPLAEIRDRFKGKIYFFGDYYVFETKNRQNRDRFKVKTFFRDYYGFWDEKLTKSGQIQSCKFSHSLFDQVSFRSNIVSIKCRSIKCGFDQVPFDQLSFDQELFDQLSDHGQLPPQVSKTWAKSKFFGQR